MSKSSRSKAKSHSSDTTTDVVDVSSSRPSPTSGAAWQQLPESDRWGEWAKHLTSRRRPADLTQLCAHATLHPLRWALPDHFTAVDRDGQVRQIMQLATGRKFAEPQMAAHLGRWLEQQPTQEPDSLSALHALLWCHALPHLVQIVSEDDWRKLLAQLEQIIDAAAGLDVHDDPLAHQILNGELPLTLAYLLPEVRRLRLRWESAKRALSYGAIELLDGEGLPNARHVGTLRSLLACWTRCVLLSSAAGWECFDEESRNQFEWFKRQALRLTRADGTLVLSQGASGDWSPDLFQAALRTGADKEDRTIAKLILPGEHHEISDRHLRKLPEPSVYSEWSETCVMRSHWSRKSPQFTCLFSDRRLRSELSVGPRLLWSGDCEPQLLVNGRELARTSDWAEICRFVDEDVDYLELEAECEGGWTIERQMVLARKDDLLFLGDAVLGPEPADVQYDLVLPLVDDIRFEPEDATRDGSLGNSRAHASVLPLSLPEWRTVPAHGRLEACENRLHLRIHETAARLFAPLAIDLSRRLTLRRTWRQLTVGEHLQALPRDVAVGYRIQLGKRQWLVYRSLAPRSNRSVLGQNITSEFLLARFDPDGCVQELIEVE